MTSLAVVQFCAEEVVRQRRGPLQVFWMVEAWERALADHQEALRANWRVQMQPPFTNAQIQEWAHLIERDVNEQGRWRRVGVRVGYHACPPPAEVPHLMSRWATNLPSMTAEEAYKEFEGVHPFEDGNGRVGKVIFNWLRGTLDEPALPPDFWGIENP